MYFTITGYTSFSLHLKCIENFRYLSVVLYTLGNPQSKVTLLHKLTRTFGLVRMNQHF